MNILVFDWDDSIAPLVRSALSALGHRVSCESQGERMWLKLDSGLFDLLVLGPAGLPQELALRVEQEWPTLPLIVVGTDHAMDPIDPIVAVLPRPLCLEKFVTAIHRVEARLTHSMTLNYDMPIDLLIGEQRRAARIVRIARETVLIEPVGEACDAEEGPLALARGSHLMHAHVSFRDRRFVAVHLEPSMFTALTVTQVEEPKEGLQGVEVEHA